MLRLICKRNTSTLNTCNASYAKIGRVYEEKCRAVIEKLIEVPVKLVGGANDGGIDLLWSKEISGPVGAAEKKEVLFIGQCKYLKKQAAPEVVRALVGTLAKAPAGTVGCLLTNNTPSQSVLREMHAMSVPMMFFKIGGCDQNCKVSNGILLNHKFREMYPNVQVVPVRGSKPPQYILRFD